MTTEAFTPPDLEAQVASRKHGLITEIIECRPSATLRLEEWSAR